MIFFILIYLCLIKTDSFKLNMVNNRIFPEYKPLSKNQYNYCNELEDKEKKIVLVTGSSGTGKTLFATCVGVKKLEKKYFDKIIITRPVVNVENDIGFLPGNLNNKMDPWTRPIFDILFEHFEYTDIERKLRDKVIEIVPLGYMRGRTFKNSYIIADEMQNCNENEILSLLTRLDENSKLIITGDLEQKDVNFKSGLEIFLEKLEIFNKYKNENSICYIKFNNDDIFRSKIVKKVLEIFKFNNTETNLKKSVNFLNSTKEDSKISGSELISKKDYDILKRINNNNTIY